MKTIRDIPHLEGVKVLVRTDFNVQIKNGSVAEDFRIVSALPTINYLLKNGAHVILVSHLEVLEGESDSLMPVAETLTKLGVEVKFIKNFNESYQFIESQIGSGYKGCFLLENIRHNEGEKKNDKKFAKELASLADIYVNEAFPVSHREHASVVSVPEFIPGYAGLQFEKEIVNLAMAFDPSHPFLFILGGAKFETKLPLLTKFMQLADKIFVGGALANDLFKQKGYEVGISLVSENKIDLTNFVNNEKVMIPSDVTLQNGEFRDVDAVSKTDKIMDVGQKTIEQLKQIISSAKFILWNGPLGLYEDGYRGPTLDLAKMIADATQNGTKTIVGGGDTLAAISTLGLEGKFTFVSTGGGAMLDYLAKGTLPGIEALK